MDDPSNSPDQPDWLVSSNDNINYDNCNASNEVSPLQHPLPNYANFDHLVPPLIPDSHIPHVQIEADTAASILRNDITVAGPSFVPAFDDTKRFPEIFSSDPMIGLNDFENVHVDHRQKHNHDAPQMGFEVERPQQADEQISFLQQYNFNMNSNNNTPSNMYKENSFNPSTGAASDGPAVQNDMCKQPLSSHDMNRTQAADTSSSLPTPQATPTKPPLPTTRKIVTSKGISKPGRKRTRTRTEDMDPNLVHTCPTCGKKFAKKYNQKIHQRRHQGDLPFICEYEDCGKGFMWRSSFMRHLKVHETHPERPRKTMTSRRGTDSNGQPNAASIDVMQVSENTSIVLLNGMKLDVDHRKLESINTAVALCRLDGTACPELLDINVDVIRQSDEQIMAKRFQEVCEASNTFLDMRNPQVALIHRLLRVSPSTVESPPT